MKHACLFVHGFTGGPYELEPLAEQLRRSGWRCQLPVLPGHEDNLKRVGQVRWTDWINGMSRAAEQMKAEHGSFDLVGFSMGGLIAAFLANRFPVRRLVLLNTAFIYISPIRYGRELVDQIRTGRFREEAAGKLTSARLRASWQFAKLVRNLKPELKSVFTPTLIIQGMKDPIIHPYSARMIEQYIPGPKELKLFPNSRHMICLDTESEEVFKEVIHFLRRPLSL